MKLLPLTFFFCAYACLLIGQHCLPDGIHFERQSQIDSFTILYPGCTVIDGDVCIGDCDLPYKTSDITNLDGLAPLTSIQGQITINNNPILSSLVGLQNLTVFEEDVRISNCYALSSLDGLNQVRLMKGSFTLEFISGLESITGFDDLDTIIGTLRMTYVWDLKNVDAFSHLSYLGGYSLSGMDGLVSIPDMNNLEYLGDFILQYNPQLTAIPALPLLSVIDGKFQLSGMSHLQGLRGFENITRVNGDLLIDIADHESIRGDEAFTLNAFHQLTYVGGRFSFSAQQLDTLDGFTTLDSVGGSFSVQGSNNGFHTFPHNNHFKYIGGDIHLTTLPFLHHLQCFGGLDRIHGGLGLGSCPNLMDLSAISHFTEFGGGLEFQLLNLVDLSDLSNLTSIGGSLRIYDCNSLKNLTGLEGLNAIDGHIFIFRNQHLRSLEGIQHIDPETIKETGHYAININNNPRLEVCHVESICEALRGLKRSFQISNNAQGCDHISQIDCIDYGLSGRVYFDENQNQLLDTNEVGIPGIPVRFQPGELISPTNAEGRFFVFADSGNVYTMTIEQNSDWILTTDSLSYTSTFEAGSPDNEDHFFGLHPAFDWYDLSVDLTSNPVRCNQDVHFFLHWLNGSTRSVDGRIVLQYDPLVAYVSSVVPPSSHNAGTRELTWDIDSLALFTGQDARVTFTMPDETFVGQTMVFMAQAFIDSSGTEVQMDQVEYSAIVACAVDPNDKLVMPPGIRDKNYTLKDDPLTYTIRFENLGNAEAIDITVTDTLEALFDMNSFKVINSSFPVLTTADGHVVTFFFKNIWLEEKGQGFVTYEIKPKSDIPDLTPVENFAGIVFDFNQPIITNRTFNTLVHEICENVMVAIDTVICDGGIFMGLSEPGVYYDTVQIGSFCDSITVITLDVMGPIIIQIDTAICEGESFLGFDSTGVFTYDSIDPVTACAQIIILDLGIIPLGSGPCFTGLEQVNDIEIKVYPNPVHDEIHIEAAKPIESVKLLTIDGRLVSVEEISTTGTVMTIQLHDPILEGFYLLTIKMEGRMYYEKLIVSNAR